MNEQTGFVDTIFDVGGGVFELRVPVGGREGRMIVPKHTGGTTKVVGSPAGVSFDELLFPLLTDRKLAAHYLSEALLDWDPRVFLSALKNVATAQGVGLAGSKSKLSPEKPDLRTLESLLDDMGFRLSVEAKDAA